MELYYQSYPEDYLNQSLADRQSLPTLNGLKTPNELRTPNKLKTPVIIIPGLFGSTANWRGIAKKLSDTCPVIVIDQRNHGRSPHAGSNSYMDMVDDLHDFIEHHQLPKVILCGHSMGGKVAMLFALLHPNYVEKLAALDIAPVTYQHSHAPFLEELLKIDLSELESRKEADRALVEAIPDTGTRLFLLQSLAGSAGSYFWRINLSVLHEFMPQLVAFPEQVVAEKSNNCPTIIIYGDKSNYVSAQGFDKAQGYFPNAESQLIEGAGHWLHAEQPDKVLTALTSFVQL